MRTPAHFDNMNFLKIIIEKVYSQIGLLLQIRLLIARSGLRLASLLLCLMPTQNRDVGDEAENRCRSRIHAVEPKDLVGPWPRPGPLVLYK